MGEKRRTNYLKIFLNKSYQVSSIFDKNLIYYKSKGSNLLKDIYIYL